MTTELLPPPYPETLTEIPDYPPIDCGKNITTIRRAISFALTENFLSQQEGVEITRWLDFAASL